MTGPSPPSETPRRRGVARRVLGPACAALGLHWFRMYLGERDLTAPLPEIGAGAPFEVREAGAEDLAAIGRVAPAPQRVACGDARRFGSTCLVACLDGRVAGWSWYDLARVTLRHVVVCELPTHAGYTCGSYVLPEHRGQKLFQLLTWHVYTRLRAAGRTRCWNLVERDNAASIAARARFGARFLAVDVVKLPGLRARVRGDGAAVLLARTGGGGDG